MAFLDKFRPGRGETATDAAQIVKAVTVPQQTKPLRRSDLVLPHVDPMEAIFGGATPATAKEIRNAGVDNWRLRRQRRAQMLGRS